MVVILFFLEKIIEIFSAEKRRLKLEFSGKKKPFIGFEPMTYALPWRYSTAELKGPFYSIHELAIFFFHYESTACMYICIYVLYAHNICLYA